MEQVDYFLKILLAIKLMTFAPCRVLPFSMQITKNYNIKNEDLISWQSTRDVHTGKVIDKAV